MAEFREVVLLAEADSFRLVILTEHVDQIYESEESPEGQRDRLWYHLNGERDLRGNRVFREIAPKPVPEPSENPFFDEMNVKVPLYDPAFTIAAKARAEQKRREES